MPPQLTSFHKGTIITFTKSSVCFYAMQYEITLQLYGPDHLCPPLSKSYASRLDVTQKKTLFCTTILLTQLPLPLLFLKVK